jgi:hypothetical protein
MGFLTAGAALALLAAGCGDPETGPPEEVERCKAQTLGDMVPLPERGAALGEGRGNEFQPYQDGDSVALVQGSQGLTMLTPVVRVDAAPEDPTDACLLVQIYLERPDYPDTWPGRVLQGVKFVKQGGYLFTDGTMYCPIPHASNDGEQPPHVALTLTVTAPGFEATHTVTVIGK